MSDEPGMYFTDIGDGPPVVLIHALGLNTGMWALQVPVLAQRYRVLRVDVRGHGRTPYGGEPLTISMLAGDISAVLKRLDIQRAAIIGISLGGVIAQALAIEYPDKVAALGLVSTVSTYTPEAREGLSVRAGIAEEQGMDPLVGPTVDRWFTDSFKARASAETSDAAMIASIRRMIAHCDPRGYAAVCRALAQVDLTGELEAISAPALVMSGGLDPGISTHSQDVLTAGIAGSTRIVLPDASHMLPVECPEEFNNHLLSFLAWSGYR